MIRLRILGRSSVHRRLAAAAVFVCVGAATAAAQSAGTQATPVRTTVPQILPVSGTLLDAEGRPLTGPLGVTFAIYEDAEGGVPLWVEVHVVPLDERGRFSAWLGTQGPGVPLDLFQSGLARWLGVQAAGHAEHARIRLLPVPYAFKAADAETLGGLPPSAFVAADPDTPGRAAGTPAGTSTSAADSTRASGDLLRADDLIVDGRLGVGTPAPNARLHVAGGELRLENANGAMTHFNFAFSSTNYIRGTTYFDSAPVYFTGGDVGIGTTSPAAKLHVTGDVRVDGNIAAKYQDVAEWVAASAPLDAGTVVIVDPEERNHVRPSDHAYDTRVAGAVSAQPGVVLGEPGEGRYLVAQSGRVRIKVDAAYGAIRPGDLLVTSPTPGHAMLSKPLVIDGQSFHRPGTLIGRALEPLNAGRGEILVLLTLQ